MSPPDAPYHFRVGGALCGDYVCGVAIVSAACGVHGASGGLVQRNAQIHEEECTNSRRGMHKFPMKTSIPPHEMMHSSLHSLNVRSILLQACPTAGEGCW
jgi:hypothetical protein